MNQRLCRLATRICKENSRLFLDDNHLKEHILKIDLDIRPFVIRKEYSKIIEIDDDSLIVGQYTDVSILESIKGKDVTDELDCLYSKYDSYKNRLFIPGGNHLVADFESVLKKGISGLIEQIDKMKKTVVTQEQYLFLTELYYTAQFVIAWSQSYVDALRDALQKCTSKKRRTELMQMADICSKVPYRPATTFREAIQSYYFTFILFSPDGMGRIDQYLYPYYEKDIREGVLTREDALSLIEELFIKIFGFLGKNEWRSANHHGVVGGYNKDGECGHNECTSLILQAITEIPVWRPQISYRITRKTTRIQLKEAIDAHCKRPDMIMFLNDDSILDGLVSVGVMREDAIEYSSSGCNETVLTGMSQPGALEGHINIMFSLDRLLNDTDRLDGIDNFEDFYKVYEEFLGDDLDIIFKYSYQNDAIKAEEKLLLCSLLTKGCISSGKSITNGGAKYNFCTWCLTGLINLVDSLSIIRQMVFEEKRYSFKELTQFLNANWKGYEKHRAYILNNGHYFGNDDDYVDALVNKVLRSVNKFAQKYTPYRGGRYLFGTLTGYEISHIVFGSTSGASVDGRHSTEPFVASISTYSGTGKKGITAYLKSVAKIDPRLLQSSVVVNLMLDRAMVDTVEKRDILASILCTYFQLGGIQLQINYISANELKDAKKNPDKYQNLRVRVTGFSGFFTSLEENLQDEIINRHLYVL